MSENRKSYLQIVREPIMSREALSFETTISTSQIQRYETDPKSTPHDNMRIIVDTLKNKYIGYLYLMENNVAQLFLPEGVERLTITEATLQLASAGRDLYTYIQDMIDCAADGEITINEQAGWMSAKNKIMELFKAYIALECADGTED